MKKQKARDIKVISGDEMTKALDHAEKMNMEFEIWWDESPYPITTKRMNPATAQAMKDVAKVAFEAGIDEGETRAAEEAAGADI